MNIICSGVQFDTDMSCIRVTRTWAKREDGTKGAENGQRLLPGNACIGLVAHGIKRIPEVVKCRC